MTDNDTPVPAVEDRERLAALLHEITTMNGIGCAHPGKPLSILEADCEKVATALLRAGISLTGSGLREAILAAPEWIGWDTIYCYWCGNTEHEGHAPDCLRAALSGESGEPKEAEG